MAGKNNKPKRAATVPPVKGKVAVWEDEGGRIAKEGKNNGRRRHAVPKRKEEEEEAGCQVRIDYPFGGETITSERYTLRIGTKEGGRMEVSLDGGPWQSCRRSQGYWWFDWSGYQPGRHTAVARLSADDAIVAQGNIVEFRVKLGKN
ncbi:MAG: hypothetical protein ABIJ96_16720 [Elusimicrobiota bacterium]